MYSREWMAKLRRKARTKAKKAAAVLEAKERQQRGASRKKKNPPKPMEVSPLSAA
jgi:hypothetical protein